MTTKSFLIKQREYLLEKKIGKNQNLSKAMAISNSLFGEIFNEFPIII